MSQAQGIPSHLATIFYMGMAILAAVLGWVLDVNIIWRGEVGTRADVWQSIGIGVGLGLFVVAVSHGLNRQFAWARRLNEDLATLLGRVSVSKAFLLAVLSGVAEELLFRGFLQHALERWMHSPWLAVFFAGLLFGAVHVGPDPRRFAPWTAMAVVLGWAIGASFVICGNVFAPIAAHFTINFLNLSTLINRTTEQ